jgi:hypothetical protein
MHARYCEDFLHTRLGGSNFVLWVSGVQKLVVGLADVVEEQGFALVMMDSRMRYLLVLHR